MFAKRSRVPRESDAPLRSTPTRLSSRLAAEDAADSSIRSSVPSNDSSLLSSPSNPLAKRTHRDSLLDSLSIHQRTLCGKLSSIGTRRECRKREREDRQGQGSREGFTGGGGSGGRSSAAASSRAGSQTGRGSQGTLLVPLQTRQACETVLTPTCSRSFSQLARTFRNRLALAGFKAQRGWQDVKLDVIEPHMEQEAARRRGQSAEVSLPPPPPPFQQQQQQYAPPPPPLPQSPYAQQHHQSPYADHSLYTPAPPPMQHQLPPPPPLQQPHYAGGMDAMLGGGAQQQKRQRQEQQEIPGPPNSYSNNSVYAPVPQPVQHVSPYSTAGVYQTSASGSSALAQHDGRPNKRRLAEPAPQSRIGQASPRARTKATRRSPGKNGQNPLSASDPNFSSFVDAATALTGMARHPSDPSINGSDEDAVNFQHQQQQHQQQQHHQQQQQHYLGGAFEQSHLNGNSPFPPPSSIPRPATPERNLNGLRGTPGAPGGSGGEGSDAAAAADLMLYLAQSPSPVQPRKTQNAIIGGEGAAVKGRRLFSGMGGGDGDFGGELGNGANGGGGGGLDAPFATQSPSLGPPSTIPDPIKSSSHQHSSLPAPSSHLLDQALAAPATPGRAREVSLNGAASWENFINASPSPTRGGRRISGTGIGGGGGAGGEGGGSPGMKGIGGEFGASRAVLPW